MKNFTTASIEPILNNTLKKAGFQTPADFLRAHGLKPDCTLEDGLFKAIEPYLYGFRYHTVQQGDSIEKLAQRYNTTPERIRAANPSNLFEGRPIVIPFDYDVVNIDPYYGYDALKKDISGLTARYPFIETASSGQSTLGRDLIEVSVGLGSKRVLIVAAHSAQDSMAAAFLSKFVEDYAAAHAFGYPLSNCDVQNLFSALKLNICPMINPDGIELALWGLSQATPTELLLAEKDFSTWFANAEGIDLRHQYDAAFENAAEIATTLSITAPGAAFYCGENPFSAAETKAVRNIVEQRSYVTAFELSASPKALRFESTHEATAELAQQILAGTQNKTPIKTAFIDNGGFIKWFQSQTDAPAIHLQTGTDTDDYDAFAASLLAALTHISTI